MARISKIQQEMNEKNGLTETKEEPTCVDFKYIERLEAAVAELYARVSDLESKVAKKPFKSTINKIETFNGEADVEPRVEAGLRLSDFDKLVSAKNAVKILPPNLIVDGRHTKENISAICGFQVDDDMWDAIYENYVHEPY